MFVIFFPPRRNHSVQSNSMFLAFFSFMFLILNLTTELPNPAPMIKKVYMIVSRVSSSDIFLETKIKCRKTF